MTLDAAFEILRETCRDEELPEAIDVIAETLDDTIYALAEAVKALAAIKETSK